MRIVLVSGYYLNDRYIEDSRESVEVVANGRGRDLLDLAKNRSWPDHLRRKLSELFLETSERETLKLDQTLEEQGLREGSEVRLRFRSR